MIKILVCLASMSLLLLAGCGGGGGGGSTGSPSGGGQTSTTSMKLTMVLQGTTASNVKAIQTTVTFPAGVVLQTDAIGKTLDGVVIATGSATNGLFAAKFTPATSTTAVTLTLGHTTNGNLIAGDLFIINADLTAGSTAPAASAFILTNTSLIDMDGIAVSGASLSIQ